MGPQHLQAMGIESVIRIDDSQMLLARWALNMRAAGLAQRTIDNRLWEVRHTARIVGEHPAGFSPDQLRERLALMDNPHSRAAVAGALRAWHVWLATEGVRADNPMCGIRPRVPRRCPRPCSTWSLTRMLEVAPAHTRAILMLASMAGLRVHEVAKVRGDDFDLDGGTLRVVGKGGVEAVLPLHPDLAALAATMPARGWWFPSPVNAGRPVHRCWVMDRVHDTAALAGVQVTSHQVRHWFGTWLVRQGADLRTAQTLLRHASLSTTQVYVEVADESRRVAIMGLPGLT